MKVLFVLTVLVVAWLAPWSAGAEPASVLVEAESFRDRGGWSIDQQSMDQMGSTLHWDSEDIGRAVPGLPVAASHRRRLVHGDDADDPQPQQLGDRLLLQRRDPDRTDPRLHAPRDLRQLGLPQQDPPFDRGFEIIRKSFNKAPNAPWTWMVLAIGEYRARHYEKAIRVARTAYRQAAQLPPNGQIHAKCMTLSVEAAALARSRQEDKATAVVQRLERMLNNELPKMNEPNVFWHGRAVAELLCDEARTLLEGRSNDTLKSN